MHIVDIMISVNSIFVCLYCFLVNSAPYVICIFCRFMRAVKVGTEILIDARTEKLGKSLAFLSIDIKNKDDTKLIATGTHTKHVGASNS